MPPKRSKLDDGSTQVIERPDEEPQEELRRKQRNDSTSCASSPVSTAASSGSSNAPQRKSAFDEMKAAAKLSSATSAPKKQQQQQSTNNGAQQISRLVGEGNMQPLSSVDAEQKAASVVSHRRSWVWSHINASSPTENVCKRCSERFSKRSSTSSLAAHLRSHGISKPKQLKQPKQASEPGQVRLTRPEVVDPTGELLDAWSTFFVNSSTALEWADSPEFRRALEATIACGNPDVVDSICRHLQKTIRRRAADMLSG